LVRVEVSRVCLVPSIACIGAEKIVLLHDMGCTMDIKRSIQLY
jgi:hypothetical protein